MRSKTLIPSRSASISRRDVTRGALAAGALTVLGAPAIAQGYPGGDVHFICAFPAGGGADIMVRYMADKMRPLMGHTIVVENKPGALGNIATEYLARAKPDGQTVLIHGASAVAAAAAILRNPTVDVSTLQIAGTINKQPTMLAVHTSKPWKTLADVTAAMKEKKEKGTYATVNPVAKVMGAIYKKTAALETVEVIYKAAPDTLNDLASGAIDYIMSDNVFTMGQVREGRLRALAVSTPQRLQASPDIPTMSESGVPMDITSYFTAIVPAGTPKPIVDQLGKWVSQIVATDETRKFLAGFASDPWVSTPAEAQAYFLKDIANWKNYVQIADIERQG